MPIDTLRSSEGLLLARRCQRRQHSASRRCLRRGGALEGRELPWRGGQAFVQLRTAPVCQLHSTDSHLDQQLVRQGSDAHAGGAGRLRRHAACSRAEGGGVCCCSTSSATGGHRPSL